MAQSWRLEAVSPCSVQQQAGVSRPSSGHRCPLVSSPQVDWLLGTFSRSTGNSTTVFEYTLTPRLTVIHSSPLFTILGNT